MDTQTQNVTDATDHSIHASATAGVVCNSKAKNAKKTVSESVKPVQTKCV